MIQQSGVLLTLGRRFLSNLKVSRIDESIYKAEARTTKELKELSELLNKLPEAIVVRLGPFYGISPNTQQEAKILESFVDASKQKSPQKPS